MPWTLADVNRHNRKANTPKKRRMWAAVANKTLEKTESDQRAIIAANATLKHYARTSR